MPFKINNSLEKEMATHSSILAWKNPWTEESGGLKSMGLHDWAYVHEDGGRWVGSNKLVELKKKKFLNIQWSKLEIGLRNEFLQIAFDPNLSWTLRSLMTFMLLNISVLILLDRSAASEFITPWNKYFLHLASGIPRAFSWLSLRRCCCTAPSPSSFLVPPL